jgi:glycine/D-amino acid oxidase-like deaminating enzyme
MHFAIIGQGLSGSALAIETAKRGHEITCFDLNVANSSSRVAIGLVNPLVLKNKTLFDPSQVYFNYFDRFFKDISKLFERDFLSRNLIREVLQEKQEIHKWNSLQNNSKFDSFIGPIENLNIPTIKGIGMGIIKKSCRLDIKSYLKTVREWLKENHHLREERVNSIRLIGEKISVNDEKYDGLLLAEGVEAYWTEKIFGKLDLSPTKGEGIIIKSRRSNFDFPVHRNIFLLPEKKNIYTVGSTFNHNFSLQSPSAEGKKTLIKDLSKWFLDDYEVIDHWAGIRPTTKSRKICFGWHSKYKNIGFLNGLGTRGALTSPFYSSHLLSIHSK